MSRKLLRKAAAAWIEAAQIEGLDVVHPGILQEIPWAEHSSDPTYSCQATVFIRPRKELRIAGGGPTNGQKMITSGAVVTLWFRSADGSDWLGAQDRFDDICEDVIRQIRAGGRTLGQTPDRILSAGEFEAGIAQNNAEPVADNGGVLFARCDISFEIDEVINT
jgi:hypothetical protein